MADQVDFPDIYIDASAGDGGVGSEADPYNEFSDINWTTGGDNSIYDYYAGSPAASVTINLKRGETWTAALLSGCAGTVTYPIKIQGYGSGANPLVDRVIDISTASYKWTASGSGTNEWYLEAAAGGDPGLSEPMQVFIDGTRCTWGDSELGSLDDHQFEWGDNDSLGYSTVYIRDDTGDPDTQGTLIEASDGEGYYSIYIRHDNYVIDGVDCSRSSGNGVRSQSENVVYKNSVANYSYGAGWQLYEGAHNNELNNVEIHDCVFANIGLSGGSVNTPIENVLITGCDIHDVQEKLTGGWLEGAGIKTFAFKDSTITKSKFYNNSQGGIRIDGLSVTDARGGGDNVTISENECYANGNAQIYIEYSANNIIKHNHCHTPTDGDACIKLTNTISINNKVFGNILEDATGMHGILCQAAGDTANGTQIYNNLAYNCRRAYAVYYGHGTVLKNNIAIASTEADITVGAGYTDIDSDYNCFTGDGNWLGVEYTVSSQATLAGWQSHSGLDGNSIDDDPLVTNAAGGDFTLTSSSPCIDIGLSSLGPPYNECLLPGSSWPDGVITGSQDDY